MNAAVAFSLENLQTAPGPCQGLAQNLKVFGSRNITPPNHRPNHGDRNAAVSQTICSKTFAERSADALKRRLHPNTNLRAHDLANAIRVSEATIWNVVGCSSKSGPSGRVFHKLVEFFGAGFLHEVFGGPGIHVIDPRSARKAAHIQRIAELQAELEAMG